MSTDPALPTLGALDRLAARASGLTASDAVMPVRPSIFEPAVDATTQPEDSPEEHDPASNQGDPRTPRRDDMGALLTRMSSPRTDAPAAVSPVLHIRRTTAAEAAPVLGRQLPVAPTVSQIVHVEQSGGHDGPIEPRLVQSAPRIVERRTETLSRVVSRVEPPARSAVLERPALATVPLDARPGRAQPAVPLRVTSIQPPRRQMDHPIEHTRLDRQVVQVTIGRVEIRASSPRASEVKTDASRRSPHEPGLETYLRRRALGGRS